MNLNLSSRKEGSRNSRVPQMPVKFSLEDIYIHFTESIKMVQNLGDVITCNPNCCQDICDNIFRSQFVLAEAALDFYIHEVSKFCLYKMYTGIFDKTEKYSKLSLEMHELEVAVQSKTDDWFFEYVNNHFRRSVFLSGNAMQDQLNLIGVSFNSVMESAFPQPSEKNKEEASRKYGKAQIKKLFDRRNAIAHQNDRSHEDSAFTSITKNDVDECIEIIENIVSSIHKIVNNHLVQ